MNRALFNLGAASYAVLVSLCEPHIWWLDTTLRMGAAVLVCVAVAQAREPKERA